jgi:hypothetical protein
MNKHTQDLGTKLEQEMALANDCDCEWCENYRLEHGFREIIDDDFYAIGDLITKDKQTYFRVNKRQKRRNSKMYAYCISVVPEKLEVKK